MLRPGTVADIPSGPVLLAAVALIFAMIGLAAVTSAWVATSVIGARGRPFRLVPASLGFVAGVVAYLVWGPGLELVPIAAVVVGGAALGAILQRAAVRGSHHEVSLVWRVLGGLIVGGSIGGGIGLLPSAAVGSVGAFLLATGLGAIIGALIAGRPPLSSSP